ncbi:hypothetical protein TRVL_05367 [Trypanosoma vivax]|nr:hypothetical protein TRVL_05367 [Trypanosoma vivax]
MRIFCHERSKRKKFTYSVCVPRTRCHPALPGVVNKVMQKSLRTITPAPWLPWLCVRLNVDLGACRWRSSGRFSHCEAHCRHHRTTACVSCNNSTFGLPTVNEMRATRSNTGLSGWGKRKDGEARAQRGHNTRKMCLKCYHVYLFHFVLLLF